MSGETDQKSKIINRVIRDQRIFLCVSWRTWRLTLTQTLLRLPNFKNFDTCPPQEDSSFKTPRYCSSSSPHSPPRGWMVGSSVTPGFPAGSLRDHPGLQYRPPRRGLNIVRLRVPPSPTASSAIRNNSLLPGEGPGVRVGYHIGRPAGLGFRDEPVFFQKSWPFQR